MTLFVTFTVSGLVMVCLLIHKQMEISYGRGLVVRGFLHSADVKVREWYLHLRGWLFMVNGRNIVRSVNWFFVHVARGIMHISRRIHTVAHTTAENLSQSKEALDMRNITPTTSEYLKKIGENSNTSAISDSHKKRHGAAGAIS